MTFAKEINAKDLPKLVEMLKSKNTVLFIYAEWCMHCKMFKPVWNSFIENNKKNTPVRKNFQFLSIESTMLNKLSDTNKKAFEYIAKTKTSPEVYFPKIMVFLKNGERTVKEEYKKDRSEEGLLSYVKSKLPAEEKKKELKSTKEKLTKMKWNDSNDNMQRRRSNNHENESDKQQLAHMIDQIINKYLGL